MAEQCTLNSEINSRECVTLLCKQLPCAESIRTLRRPDEHGGRLAETAEFRVRFNNVTLKSVRRRAQAENGNGSTGPSACDLGPEKPKRWRHGANEVDDGRGGR